MANSHLGSSAKDKLPPQRGVGRINSARGNGLRGSYLSKRSKTFGTGPPAGDRQGRYRKRRAWCWLLEYHSFIPVDESPVFDVPADGAGEDDLFEVASFLDK